MVCDDRSYDIYPKVVSVRTPHVITIKARPDATYFSPGAVYKILVCPLEEGYPEYYKTAPYTEYQATADSTGVLKFCHTFGREEEYYIRIQLTGTDSWIVLAMYALEPDLAERLPFKGNLHTHTTGSDGQESGPVAATNFREMGYDFIGITDHYRYLPALQTLDFFKDVDMDFTIVPGEEVHLPDNDVHIVNFGGKFSVNALLLDYVPSSEVGNDDSVRAMPGVTPAPIISIEEYFNTIRNLAKTLRLPQDVNAFMYASCLWAYRMIAKAEGLSIFCHPCSLYYGVFQVPLPFTRYMLAQKPFDAFEVLGGEDIFEEHGYQPILYYENFFSKNEFPVVGNSDCHCSADPHEANIAFSFVFSKANTIEELVQSVKDGYSVAIDGSSEKVNFVGPFRLVKYARFLHEHYFVDHEISCRMDAYLMRRYVDGEQKVVPLLREQKKKIEDFRKKYFAP